MDLAAFRDAQRKVSRPGSRGWWEHIQLTDEQWDTLHAAMDDISITDRAIATVVTSWGQPLTMHQVGHYRRKRRG